MGTIGALFPMAIPLGMALGGFLLTHFPLPAVFIWMGGLSILSGIPFLFPIRDDLTDALSSLSVCSSDHLADRVNLASGAPLAISAPPTAVEDTLPAD